MNRRDEEVDDEIIREVRAAGEAYFAEFDFDIRKVFADLREKQKAHPERMSKLKPVKLRNRVPTSK